MIHATMSNDEQLSCEVANDQTITGKADSTLEISGSISSKENVTGYVDPSESIRGTPNQNESLTGGMAAAYSVHGIDGGYYIPSVEDGELTWEASKAGMPSVPGAHIAGKDGKDGYTPVKGVDYVDGEPGKDGEDGITPHIGQNGNWYIGKTDTGIPATGPEGKPGQPGEPGKDGLPGKDGYTPQKNVDYFDGKDGLPGADGKPGYTPVKGVDYFDGKDGYTPVKGVDYFDGEKGEPGYTPVKGIDYFDGNPGEPGIPGVDGKDGYTPVKGVDYFDGQPGADGKDGYTPVKGVDYFDGEPGRDGSDGRDGRDGVSVTHEWNGTVLSVTTASGTSSADLKGEPGAEGKTPQKGTDYWTDADRLDIFKAIYPVGAIYMSTTSTNPVTLFGFGTWEQIKDTFLLAAGNTYAAGSTGGEATHTLTTDEMPSHHHTAHGIGISTTASGKNLALRSVELGNQHTGTAIMRVNNTGGDQAHNNMPPYLAVYIWKRTA